MKIHGKEIRAVASDFDGTIIKKGTYAPPELFYDVAGRLVERGIPFIAASGRQYRNLRRMLAPIADKISYIAENGCLVVYQGQIIYKSSFVRETAMELIRDMLPIAGTEVMASGEQTCYILPRDSAFEDRMRNKIKNDITITSDFSAVSEDFIKISIYWKNGKIPEDKKQFFWEKYKDRLQVVDGGNGWLDFNMKEAGKGPALKILAGRLGISPKEIIAFGDSENDISMLQVSGISYVVDTALPHVKAHADYVCESVEEVLQKYFL